MTDRARELLERALESFDYNGVVNDFVLEEIRAFLADTNPSETINNPEVDRSEPKVPFVRLTEEEVNEFVGGVDCDRNYELICAVENRLAEKNK